MRLRLNNSHVTQTEEKEVREGRVEVSFDNGLTWGTICATNWSFREANVICHQLNLGYAASTAQTLIYGDSKRYPWKMVGPVCQGTEASLIECSREERYPKFCNLNNNKVAVVRCDEKSPDLVLNIAHIRKSIHLVTKRLSALKCAMEEKCLSRDAYEIQTSPPEAERKLLRFTTTAENVGTADFFPYADYKSWQWHQCHNHYHSMEEFATFDIYDMHYKKQAEGHKASFCLEDTGCRRGVSRRHSCGNKTQGISVGCWDTYSAFIDCQWVDVTRLIPHAFYVLRIVINPGCRIGEISYENNVVECLLYYTGDQWTTFALSCVNASSKLQIDFWSKFKADLGIE